MTSQMRRWWLALAVGGALLAACSSGVEGVDVPRAGGDASDARPADARDDRSVTPTVDAGDGGMDSAIVPPPDALDAPDAPSPPLDVTPPPDDAITPLDGTSPPPDGPDSAACAAPRVRCTSGSTTVCADLAADPANCGACNNPCPARPHATPTCASMACGLACDTGYGNCNGTLGDGCETALQTSVTDCGRCGTICPAPAGGGAAACVAGACTGTCPTGRTLCGGACVDTATDPANCGACGTACGAGRACAGGTCGAPCAPPNTVCGAACVDLQTDENNCGACGTRCTVAGQSCWTGACSYLEFMYWINQRRATGTTCGGTAYPAVATVSPDASGRINAASQRHASDMASHLMLTVTGTDGSTPASRLTDARYVWTNFRFFVFNAAPSETPQSIVASMFADPTLCPALMAAGLRDFGMGAALGTDATYYAAFYLATGSTPP